MKNRFNLPFTLHLLAILVRFLMCYPLIFWASVQGGNIHSGVVSLVAFLLSILIGYAGFGFRKWQKYHQLPNTVSVKWNLMFYLLGILLVFLAALFSAFLDSNYFLTGAVVICCTFCFLTGGKYSYLDYGIVLQADVLYIGFGCQIVAIILLEIMRKDYSLSVPIVVFLLAVICYALVENQANIDHMMDRRKHDRSILPKQVRQYNVMLLGVLSGIGCLALFTREILAHIFAVVGALLLKAVFYVLKLFGKLINFLMPLSEQSPIKTPEEQVQKFEETLEGTGSAFPVGWILLIIIIVLLIWKHSSILQALNRWFHRLPIFRHMPASNEYYEDVVEWLPSEERVRIKKTHKNTFKNWKKEFLRYVKMEEGSEKFRCGYSLLLRWVSLKGTQLALSDTTLEILEKAKYCLYPLSGDEVTDSYNRLRYGEKNISSKEFQTLDQLLKQLSKDKSKK